MTGWQLIETAPKDGTPVLLWDPNSMWEPLCFVVVARWFDGEWQFLDSATADEYPGNGTSHATHWMPLPPAPSQSATDGYYPSERDAP